MVSGCNRELKAHYYSAASLTHWSIMPQTLELIHVPQHTWQDTCTTSSHIILTLGRPFLPISYPVSLSAKRGAASTIFNEYVAARDRTRELPSHGADTLPTELPGPVSNIMISSLGNKDDGRLLDVYLWFENEITFFLFFLMVPEEDAVFPGDLFMSATIAYEQTFRHRPAWRKHDAIFFSNICQITLFS